MTPTLTEIPLANLSLALIPALVVFAIYAYWSLQTGKLLYTLSRMVLQLLLIGYVLTFLFQTQHPALILSVLTVMLLAASWIALGSMKTDNKIQKWTLFQQTFLAIFVGGGFTLIIITQVVLQLDPWFMPQYMIPLAGMVFANAMTSVSLVSERFQSEIAHKVPYLNARNTAFQASMIPMMNSLLAVGLVSLPGMMTGQILSGVDPLIAVRYQIMVMLMILSSAGISAALFLHLAYKEPTKQGN